jgi:ABC-type uncharacterized transport system permease subunit
LFQLDQGPFNIFQRAGHRLGQSHGHGISIKVMLMTPAFRNMDSTLEEAARVGGASNLRHAFQSHSAFDGVADDDGVGLAAAARFSVV